MALSAVGFAYCGKEAEEFADDIVAAIRQDVATFIRANIDMQGLDFPDAESVAVWLEETA
jgi:methionine synthase II (cobalamin-independent)